MANTDLMIDLETLATSNDAAIVTMAAIRFDPHADYSKIKVEDLPPNQIMYRRIDLDSCTGIGCKVNEETIGPRFLSNTNGYTCHGSVLYSRQGCR